MSNGMGTRMVALLACATVLGAGVGFMALQSSAPVEAGLAVSARTAAGPMRR